ncbi:hypothetical protein PLESTB_001233600 [Pleodorina starrii]|uniref:Anaphase-promoting complex subunit 4 n=1 Tax=Pleodorina starrii TaxID=330485 RepID=A0A9W6BSN6_9CHLO|nr:hypothetical protein PLESTB_001233600 [Pleodorina starrii]
MYDGASSGPASNDSDGGARGSPNAFTVLYEKALSQQVVLGCWCPTMDLLALVSDDGQLGVYRLEWQKLWVACPDTPITALCWRPDGKVLASGHRHGAVSLYNVEACELFRTLRAPLAPSPICHLSWVQGLAPHPATTTPALHLAYRYRHTRFFPAPPPGREQGAGGAALAAAPPAGGAGAAGKVGAAAPPGVGGGAAGAHEWPPPPDSLDVLVTSDAGGGVSMFACGEVLVASLPPRATSGDSGDGSGSGSRGGDADEPSVAAAAAASSARGELPGMLQAVVSRDLASLLVVSEPAAAAEVMAEGDGSVGGGAGGGAAAAAAATLSVYGCGKLGSCQGEILELSLLAGLVGGRLEAAQAALAAAARAWKGAASELSKRMDEQLREALESHGHDPDDVLGELTCMLASGHVSPPLHAFLTSYLTKAGLRRLAKSVDTAVQEVSSQLLDGVLPALHLVAFVVGELRGRARAANITHTLGLQERAVAVAEVEAAKALLQAEALRQRLTRVGGQYRVFFTWLLKTLQSLEETRPPGAEGPLPGVPLPGAGSLADAPLCLPTLLSLLEEGGQLSADAVARDLDASQSTLGLPVGSTTFPPDLLPHLKALQQAAFPMPPPEAEGEGAAAAAAPAGAAAAGSAGGGGSSWPDRPLQRQLGLLREMCRGAFGRLQADVSPSVQLLARMPLLPPPSPQWGPRPDGSSGCGGGDGGTRCCVALPQIRTEQHQQPQPPHQAAGGGPRPALLACVMPAEAAALAGAGSGAGGEVLLLMRVVLESQRGPQVSACLLTMPPGTRVVGLSYYRSAQLALLLGPAAGTDPRVVAEAGAGAAAVAAAGKGLLALVPTEGLRMCDVGTGGFGAGGAAAPLQQNVAQLCAARGAVAAWPVPGCRLRKAAGGAAAVGGAGGGGGGGGVVGGGGGGGGGEGGWLPPLLVSGPRGLAAAFTTGCRSLMIDLEEDEEGEGDEEEEEDGGEGGGGREAEEGEEAGEEEEEEEEEAGDGGGEGEGGEAAGGGGGAAEEEVDCMEEDE